MDDSDPKIIWRGIGRGLDRCFPPDQEAPDSIENLLSLLRQRDQSSQDNNQGG